eukprot:7804719-Alexandrium_andersonii.AAC.1
MTRMPIGVEGQCTNFTAQCMEDSNLPGIWGLDSMVDRRAILDLSDRANLKLITTNPRGETSAFRLEIANGHL